MIVDAHNDLLLELALRRDEPDAFARRWLPKLDEGGVALQVCPIYAADAPAGEARERARIEAGEFDRAVRENGDRVLQVRSRGDLDAVGGARIGLMLSLEGAEPLEGDVSAFDELWERGVRMVGLTWNHANEFAAGIDEPGGGLTELGRRLVDRLVERGAIIDLAHASERTFAEVLERASAAAVVVSHAGCRAVNETPRNLSDAQLEALAERGGVLGMMALGLVVHPARPTVERLIDHVDHAVAVMGIEHVGLGTDFIDQVADAEAEAGMEPADVLRSARVANGGRSFGLDGLTGPEHFGVLVEGLRRRGYDADRLDAIRAQNFLRVFRAALR